MNAAADTALSNGAALRARRHVTGRDFQTVFRYLSRRKIVPLLGFIIGAGIAVGILALSPPLYSASSRVMIGGHMGQGAAIASEIEIIESTPVLSKVAGMLGLYRDQRFTRETMVEKVLRDGNEENALRERVLGRLSDMLYVRRIPDTSIIELTVRHPNPDRAAQIANVVLSAYRERKMDERFEQTRQIDGWMGRQIELVKTQADDAKKRLEAFRMENGIVYDEEFDGSGTQELKEEIDSTRTSMERLKAQLDRMKAYSRGGSKNVDPTLKAQERKLQAELDELSQRYGDKHPKIVAKKAEISAVRGRMGRKTIDPTKGIEAEIKRSSDRLHALEMELATVSKSAEGERQKVLEAEALKADVERTARLYDNLLVKYQDMTTRSELQEDGVSIISMATIPSKPDRNERIRFVVAFGFAGFMIGFALVLGRALCNTGFNSAEQLESLAGYPVFAAIPNGAMKGVAIHHTVIEKPAAIMAESLRSLRVALRLRSQSGPRGPRVIALTSTLPDEGKTSLAVMLAMIAAKSGERVAIVDCDLRRPSLHKAFGIGNARGLQDYLSNNAGLEDSIYRRDPSGVHVVTAKAVPSYSLTLLTSGRMEQMIEALREQYDLVILDAPSSLAFADARVLARMVDQMLYVVAWNRTRRAGVLTSLKAYADMRYENLALVLNKVDLREYLRESASAVIYQYGQDAEDDA